jgi:pyridoxal phosphate enzyme (YggS family)
LFVPPLGFTDTPDAIQLAGPPRIGRQRTSEEGAVATGVAELEYRQHLNESLDRVRDRVAASALRAGREPEDVTLVGVSKGHPVEAVRAALSLGLIELGENRVGELEAKCAGVNWHLIGHVQSRKARRVIELAPELFHALDSVRLAERMSRIALEEDRVLPVLVEVNVSGEEAKGGLDMASAFEDLGRILSLGGIEVQGLMTMAPFTDDAATLRRTFCGLRQLADEARGTLDYGGSHLSMGMTNDFEIAIEEGSTLVRIGTALFGARN